MIPIAGNKELIVGIDLGTTNSLIALSDGKQSQVFKDGDSPLIPSVIVFDENGRIQAVGQRAKTLKSVEPKRAVYSVKRLMGRGLEDLETVERELPFDFSLSSQEVLRVRAGNYAYTAVELSAEILKRCKLVAENVLGRPIRKAVVTVPAYFNDAQRSATTLAGQLAGLEVVRILNEPTAAALAFGIGRDNESTTVAVYDFGGGTFDISILKVTCGVFEVLSTDGDTHLGGDDLDFALYQAFVKRAGVAPKKEEDRISVLHQLENLKRKLTDEAEIEASIYWDGKVQWNGVFTREELSEIFRPVIERTLQSCRSALAASGLEISAIEHLVFVGGSTRVPLVRELASQFFGKKPAEGIDPDQVVALGAAIQGAILAGEKKNTLLLDVVPLSLGIETMGGLISKIIHRNTTVPCSAFEDFTTYVDNQTGVDVHIVQGERELVQDCRSLGRFKLKIAPAPAGYPKVRVEFLMDANGMLRAHATDLRTKEFAELEVRPSFGLSDSEIERMLAESFKYAERDFAERQLIEAKNQARALLRATEKSFENPLLDRVFVERQKARIGPVMKALERDIEMAPSDVIVLRTRELDHMTQELAQQILDHALRNRLKDRTVAEAR